MFTETIIGTPPSDEETIAFLSASQKQIQDGLGPDDLSRSIDIELFSTDDMSGSMALFLMSMGWQAVRHGRGKALTLEDRKALRKALVAADRLVSRFLSEHARTSSTSLLQRFHQNLQEAQVVRIQRKFKELNFAFDGFARMETGGEKAGVPSRCTRAALRYMELVASIPDDILREDAGAAATVASLEESMRQWQDVSRPLHDQLVRVHNRKQWIRAVFLPRLWLPEGRPMPDNLYDKIINFSVPPVEEAHATLVVLGCFRNRYNELLPLEARNGCEELFETMRRLVGGSVQAVFGDGAVYWSASEVRRNPKVPSVIVVKTDFGFVRFKVLDFTSIVCSNRFPREGRFKALDIPRFSTSLLRETFSAADLTGPIAALVTLHVDRHCNSCRHFVSETKIVCQTLTRAIGPGTPIALVDPMPTETRHEQTVCRFKRRLLPEDRRRLANVNFYNTGPGRLQACIEKPFADLCTGMLHTG